MSIFDRTSEEAFKQHGSPETILGIEGLRKSFGDVEVLHGIDLSIQARKLTLIKGNSGSGKSTLLQCISGISSPDEGSVLYGDVDITKLNPKTMERVRGMKFGFMFQSSLLLHGFEDAESNIRIPHGLVGTKLGEDRFDHVVETLGIQDLLGRQTGTLSGGEQQRVALARALVHDPEIVFADEPTYALDTENKKRVHELLRSVVDEGTTVVMVSHEPTAYQFADEVVTVQDGLVVDVSHFVQA